MRKHHSGTIAMKSAVTILLLIASGARAQNAPASYPNMAPVEQYLMPDRAAEIALARSAGPPSVANDAKILVLGRHGYETAVEGKNGFVCLVERAWASPIDDPGFWNPKLRGPLCLNAAAARSYLPRALKKTDLVLAGRNKAEMADAVTAAIDKKELPPMESGAMCYMLSKQGYLGDQNGHWHPHLMFFSSQAPAAWGANQPDSPLYAIDNSWEHLTIFLIPVDKWSDGSSDR